MTDEFEIKAKANDGSERVWNRSKLEVAKSIANSAVKKLGFTIAIVVNVHGGHRSQPLYVVLDVDVDDDDDDYLPPILGGVTS